MASGWNLTMMVPKRPAPNNSQPRIPHLSIYPRDPITETENGNILEPKYYAEEVIGHPNHYLKIWLKYDYWCLGIGGRNQQKFITLGQRVGPPYPYYSHITPIRIPKDMGIVWEAYNKGVPLLGVPGGSPFIFPWLNCWFEGMTNKNIAIRHLKRSGGRTGCL